MRVAIIGAGIAGLAAAWELSGGPEPPETIVFDPGPVGGRIQTEPFLGHAVDTGPDAFIARTPDGLQLAREVGLEDELVAPVAGRAQVLVRGRLRPLPDGLVLGAPTRLRPLTRSGILGPVGLARAGLDLVLPRTPWPDDLSVNDLVARRLGHQVADRLVAPLVGAIHAGRAEDLSAVFTTPQLDGAARTHRSMLQGLRALPKPPPAPMFLAPRAGMARLVECLVEALKGRGVSFERMAVGRIGSTKDGAVVIEPHGIFDGAVLAAPAPAAAGVLDAAAPEVAGALRAIRWSSVAVVTAAYRTVELPLPDKVSGFVVAPGERMLMTACSYGSSKWPHWSDPDNVVLRISAGRAGDERALQLRDGELVDRLQHEVALALGISTGPLQWRVNRWREAFPQYEVGHGARLERIEAARRRDVPHVALAGASYRGSGISACIASGRHAARALTAQTSGT